MTAIRGFTLIELLIVAAILAITTITVVPSMSNLISDNRLSSVTADFVDALQLAKSESIARLTRVNVCKMNPTNNNICIGTGGWEQGWIIYADVNDSGTLNTPGDQIIMTREHLRSVDPKITIRGTAEITSLVAFRPTGSTNLTALAHVIICDTRGFSKAKGILVTLSGNASVLEAATTGKTHCTNLSL